MYLAGLLSVITELCNNGYLCCISSDLLTWILMWKQHDQAHSNGFVGAALGLDWSHYQLVSGIKLSGHVIVSQNFHREDAEGIKWMLSVWQMNEQDRYGSGHRTAAVLLPGFAINWQQNLVTRQPQFRDLTNIINFLIDQNALSRLTAAKNAPTTDLTTG